MRNHLIALFLLGLALNGGCASAATSGASNGLVARIHFAGTASVSADPSAARLNEIAALPESKALREQTLQKLSTAPFRYLNGKAAVQSDHADLLRPLVEDLFGAESYLEIAGATNPLPDLLLAVRLDNNRAALWRTNLAKVLTSWTALSVSNYQAGGYAGWELKKHEWPNCIRFIRAGDWVLFGWGQNDLSLQPAMLQRIKDTGRPANALTTNWLEAWVDLPALASRLPAIPFPWPQAQITVQGRKDAARPQSYVRPELVMKFPAPLKMTLDPWRIPSNSVSASIDSFTAYRGIAPWLDAIKPVRALNANPLPNQLFVWAGDKIPFETSFALPVPDATNYLKRIQSGLRSILNSSMTNWTMPNAAYWTTNSTIEVGGNPFFAPHLAAIHESAGDFLSGGIFPNLTAPGPFPPALAGEILKRPDLVCYDWEITGARVEQWRVLSQLGMVLTGQPVTTTNTVAQVWIDAVKKKLDSCGTIVTLTAPDQLTLVRNSPIGFSSFEITWLAYWLDAEDFPLNARYYDELHPRPPIRKSPSP